MLGINGESQTGSHPTSRPTWIWRTLWI